MVQTIQEETITCTKKQSQEISNHPTILNEVADTTILERRTSTKKQLTYYLKFTKCPSGQIAKSIGNEREVQSFRIRLAEIPVDVFICPSLGSAELIIRVSVITD